MLLVCSLIVSLTGEFHSDAGSWRHIRRSSRGKQEGWGTLATRLAGESNTHCSHWQLVPTGVPTPCRVLMVRAITTGRELPV